jgi:hypothetical protein
MTRVKFAGLAICLIIIVRFAIVRMMPPTDRDAG